jgi:tRNA threonylcarbamoyladenosine biosynthesis protein TsaB
VIVLGFDTATQSTVVGLRLGDGSTLRARDDPAPDAHPGHATRLLGMAGELLSQAGLGWGALQRVAVGVGPGRFTGLRVGIATARGLAQSLDLELVGVSSLQALGRAAATGRDDRRGTIAVIDARRGEAFAGAYAADADFSGESRVNGVTLDGEIAFPRPLGPAELEGVVEAVEQRGGPRGAHWRAVGDGARHFRAQLQRGGVEVARDGSPLHLIDAGAICDLGAHAGPAVSRERILPDYRRTPDAQLARERPLVRREAGS